LCCPTWAKASPRPRSSPGTCSQGTRLTSTRSSARSKRPRPSWNSPARLRVASRRCWSRPGRPSRSELRSSRWTPAVPRASRGLSLLPPQPRGTASGGEAGTGPRRLRRQKRGHQAPGPPPHPFGRAGADRRPAHRGARQASSAQTGERPGGGPAYGRAQRAERGHHPRRCAAPRRAEPAAALSAPRARAGGARTGCVACSRAGRAGRAHPGQGGAQAHGGGDGRQRVHRTARHRVSAGGRHQDREGRAEAPTAAGVRGREGLPAAAGRPGTAYRGAAAPADQRVLGRGQPGSRRQTLREPGHRGGHGSGPGGAQHQGRRPAAAA